MAGATIDPFGYAMCLVVMGLVFAIPLWRRQSMTLADLFRQRYSRNIEMLAVLLLVPGSIMWAAAQIRAFGLVLSASSGLEVEFTISIAALVVTDAVQGVALLDCIVTWRSGNYWLQLDFPYLLSLAVAFSGYVLTAGWETARFYA